MKSDHRIKLKILDGIDNECIVGIQIKESGSIDKMPIEQSVRRNSLIGNLANHRRSIFSKKDDDVNHASHLGQTLKAPEAQKRGSFAFQKRLSIFSSAQGASQTTDLLGSADRISSISQRRLSISQRRQSISHVTRPFFVVGNNFINVVSTVQLKKENIGNEHEFQLTDSFHSVFIYVYKKKLGMTQLLADVELPAIVFEPDESWHEQSLALKDETFTDKQGHQFMLFTIMNPIPCYHCKSIMYSDRSMPELEFFKCDGCGILCHEKCHNSILSTCSKVMSIKFAYLYTKEPIYDTAKCKPLLDGFFGSHIELLSLFSRVCDNLDEASFHILKILQTFPKRKAIEVISDLCRNEMTQADNYHNIFQEPSLALKVTERLMKQIAKEFLIFTLERSISQIVNDDFNCELDSSRITHEKNHPHISQKISNLENYLEQIFRAITTSPKSCPFTLRCILANIHVIAAKLYPQEPTAGYVVTNNILFRKLFIPALLGPENFGMTVPPFKTNSQRTLTILCKILQRISNLDFFENNADLNFQKMNRIISSYHPIISIYTNEVIKVSMLPDESMNSKESTSKGVTKMPWYQKVFPFCFPSKIMAPSSSDIDLFKEKSQQNLDWENLDNSFEDGISKDIDADLHVAALGRLLLRHGDKLISSCQNDKETSLAYDGLGWASLLRGKLRQQIDDIRKTTLFRIQQEYQAQFYPEDNGGHEMSYIEPGELSEKVQPSIPEVISENNSSGSDFDLSSSLNRNRSFSIKASSFRRKSQYEIIPKSSNISEGHAINLIPGESEGFLRSFILSIDSMQAGAQNQIQDDQKEGNIIEQGEEQSLETPIIAITIAEEVSKIECSSERLHRIVDSVQERSQHEIASEHEDESQKPTGLVPNKMLMEKRKSLMMNLDSILRPKEEKSSGPNLTEFAEAKSSDIPYMNSKQRPFSKIIPRSKTQKEQ